MPMFAVTLSSAVLSVVAVVRHKAEAFRNWREAREGYAALCEMDERTLHDLGLTRSDLRDATAAGYFGDPTEVIAARASERQGRRLNVGTSARQLSGPSLVPDIGSALSRTVPSM
jgi:uncharacterized protein YjiS (DUF1127 family)